MAQALLTKSLYLAGQITLSTADLAHLKSALSELTSDTRQTWSRTELLLQQDSQHHTAAKLGQVQGMMQNMEVNLQQVCAIHAHTLALRAESNVAVANQSVLFVHPKPVISDC